MGLFDKVRRAVGGDGSESADDESSDATDSEPDGRTAAEPTADSDPDGRTGEEPAADSELIGEAEDAVTEPPMGDPADESPMDDTGGSPSDESPSADSPAVAETPSPASDADDDLRTEYAETATDFAEFWGERDLDFTPDSLARLDDLVEAEWDGDRFEDATFGSEATFDDRAFTSVTRELGSYFGEVLVRDLAGEWTDETDHEAVVVVSGWDGRLAVPVFQVAANSLRETAAFARSYEALLADIDAETGEE
ncbi:prolipoprotein diacylglyceryl transferase [Haloarcula amylovorans]|uniref:hypothetical protein n=1 Tax=Haloarcula amylovorans TaxID=2562280 RepID=UPI0010766541|nr:hypothetical protein [Halomicroarcula amylolytica]